MRKVDKKVQAGVGSVLVFLLLIAFFLAVTGCAEGNIISGTSFPPGAKVVRCTEYLGQINGTFTATSARVDGCQCMLLGEPITEVVKIVASDTCQATFSPAD